MNPNCLKLTSALLLAAAGITSAASFTFDGTTIGAPTFHRPTGDEFPNAPGEIQPSGLGEVWSYHSMDFIVDQAGSYDISVTSGSFDVFLVFYSLFDPADPTSNVIALLDGGDLATTTFSKVPLQANTIYTLLTTSFWDNSNGDLEGNVPTGIFSGSINGEGRAASAVPEPSTTLLGGLTALALFRRRRKA